MIKCYIRELMAKEKIDDVQELMNRSGLSRNAVNRLYKEKDMEKASLETLIKLCGVFKCKLSDLVEYTVEN